MHHQQNHYLSQILVQQFHQCYKIIQTLLGIIDFIILMFVKPDEHLRKNEHIIISEQINLNERI